jgi:hypothetical protein
MKMKRKSIRPILLAGAMASAFLTGCAGTTFSYQDAPPTPVQFESMKAEQTFYNAILAKYFPAFDGRANEFSSNLLEVGWDHEIRQSSNVIFNEAVAAADTDHNNVITEAEANAYAATLAARTDLQKENDARSSSW